MWQSNPKAARVSSFSFERPLVLLQSDDWGRVGVRDQEGFEQLRSAGIALGATPYDFYTLESVNDVIALADLLKRHHDSVGRPPCLEMNFILANVDFEKSLTAEKQEIPLRPLTDGLPGNWKRPGLFAAFAAGIADGVFYPALHGITHFCRHAVERCLSQANDRRELLYVFWQAETPYIYWRMPWIGYEYWDPEVPPGHRFLSAMNQQHMIREAVGLFTKCFSHPPLSACAPGYRANDDTHRAWAENGIRVAQNGTANLAPYVDRHGLLQIARTIDFEPAIQPSISIESCLRTADWCFSKGIPLIVSTHAINFHSSLKNFRDGTLQQLDRLLGSLETKYPDLLYVHDADLWDIVNTGNYENVGGSVSVKVKQQSDIPCRSVASLGA